MSVQVIRATLRIALLKCLSVFMDVLVGTGTRLLMDLLLIGRAYYSVIFIELR